MNEEQLNTFYSVYTSKWEPEELDDIVLPEEEDIIDLSNY